MNLLINSVLDLVDPHCIHTIQQNWRISLLIDDSQVSTEEILTLSVSAALLFCMPDVGILNILLLAPVRIHRI